MITNTTNDVAILLIATGIKPSVTLSNLTLYLPGQSTFTNEEGDVDVGSTIYQIHDGFVTEAELSEPISLLEDGSGQIDKLFNLLTRKKGWFNDELTDIEWE